MKTNFFLTTFFSFFLVLNGIHANCAHPDYPALVALYTATNGANWTNTTNNDSPWDVTNQTNCDPCSWYGVTCENGRVIRLELTENNLIGGIPVEIGDLTQLTGLLLQNNTNLGGTIPTSIVNLTQLEDLRLWDCGLTGTIPTQLGNLNKLKILDFWGNSLTGSIPTSIGDLVNLEFLSFGNNQTLSGAIPSTIGNLIKLKVLRIDNNQFTSLPPEIGNLIALEYLYGGQNSFTGSIPSTIGSLSNLKVLRLQNNNLSGNIPNISGLTLLEELSLHDNQLTGGISFGLESLTALQRVFLNNNQLSGSIPMGIENLTSLMEFWLSNNQLTGGVIPELGALTNLQVLRLSNNLLGGTIPSTLGNLSNLQQLYISDNSLQGNLPVEIGNLSSLEFMCLFNNNLTGPIPSSFGNLNMLQFLGLYNNQLSGQILPELAALPNIASIRLYDNDFEYCFPHTFLSLCNSNTEVLANNITGTLDYNLDFSDFCANSTPICPPINDDCDSPTILNVYNSQSTCSSINGSTIAAFVGSTICSNNGTTSSVWYKWDGTAYPNGITIEVTNFSGTGGIGVGLVEVFGQSCSEGQIEGSFTALACANDNFGNDLTLPISNDLSEEGNFLSYRIVVWTEGGVAGQGDFEICVYGNSGFTCEEHVITAQTRNAPLPDIVIAEKTIQSTDIIEANGGAIYIASECITFNAGFHAKVGSDVMAMIEENPCGPPQNFLQPLVEKNTNRQTVYTTTLSVFPNPFYSTSTIQYELPESSPVQIGLYDMNGRLVQNLIPKAHQAAGTHQLSLDRNGLQAGMYYLNLLTGTERLVKKVMVLK